MVVLLDLDDDPHLFRDGNHSATAYDHLKLQLRGPLLQAGNTSDTYASDLLPARRADGKTEIESQEEERPNPNLNGFSAALSCYP